MAATGVDARLGRRLVLDEIFDLSLYRALREIAPASMRPIFDALIPIETRHVAFWQEFFGFKDVTTLDAGRRLKLALIIAVCRLFGAPAIHVVLEAIEVHGVKKYLEVWKRYGDTTLGAAVREVLEDEFKHEDMVVTADGGERRINPEMVRNLFLGLNDGLVEILGAVSGFFAAFNSSVAVVTAGFTVGVAGALSMAAGAYIGAGSEAELRETEDARKRFLGEVAHRFHLREQLGARLLARQAEPRAHSEGLRIAPGGGTRRPQVREPVPQRGRRREGRVPAVTQLGHAAQRARRVAADPDGNAATRGRGPAGQGVEAEELAGVGGALVAPARAHHADGLVAPDAAPVEGRAE